MAKLIQELKGYEKVKELVMDEIGDYSYFEAGELEWNDNYGEYDEEDEEEHYKVDIKGRTDKSKTLYFNYNKQEGMIEVELGEDSWYETCSYDWKIKYFWMALLGW